MDLFSEFRRSTILLWVLSMVAVTLLVVAGGQMLNFGLVAWPGFGLVSVCLGIIVLTAWRAYADLRELERLEVHWWNRRDALSKAGTDLRDHWMRTGEDGVFGQMKVLIDSHHARLKLVFAVRSTEVRDRSYRVRAAWFRAGIKAIDFEIRETERIAAELRSMRLAWGREVVARARAAKQCATVMAAAGMRIKSDLRLFNHHISDRAEEIFERICLDEASGKHPNDLWHDLYGLVELIDSALEQTASEAQAPDVDAEWGFEN